MLSGRDSRTGKKVVRMLFCQPFTCYLFFDQHSVGVAWLVIERVISTCVFHIGFCLYTVFFYCFWCKNLRFRYSWHRGVFYYRVFVTFVRANRGSKIRCGLQSERGIQAIKQIMHSSQVTASGGSDPQLTIETRWPARGIKNPAFANRTCVQHTPWYQPSIGQGSIADDTKHAKIGITL